MKRLNQNLTITGAFLLIASALIGALNEAKSATPQQNSLNNGTLRYFSGGGNYIQMIVSCVMINYNKPPKCHVTIASGTTFGDIDTLLISQGGNIYTTRFNTSASWTMDGPDTTSILTMM